MSTVKSVEQLEDLLGKPPAVGALKEVRALGPTARALLELSPIAGVGYRDLDGRRHTALAGGRAGFARVESAQEISFELDPGAPIAADGSAISMLFLLPGIGETFRFNGVLRSRDGAKLRVRLQLAYVHCARAILRSKLWENARAPSDVDTLQNFLRAAPFLMISSWSSDGTSDTSPRGDLPGMVRVLDEHTLLLPDRRGNQRTDTFHNLMADGRIALVALLPGSDTALHVEGKAELTHERSLLEPLALAGKPPVAALLIRVERAELLESRALREAKVWSTAAHVDRARVPNLLELTAKLVAESRGRTVRGMLAPFRGLMRRLGPLLGWANRRALSSEGYDQASK